MEKSIQIKVTLIKEDALRFEELLNDQLKDDPENMWLRRMMKAVSIALYRQPHPYWNK